jgi:hypothetical protein
MDFREMVSSRTPLYFLFSIDGKEIDATFKVWNYQMRLEYTDKRLPKPTDVCIKILFEDPEIKLDNFYYAMKFDKTYMCPHLLHSDFFKILDVVSNMYRLTKITLEDGSYVKINGFDIPKNVMAMTKGGVTFYNRFGFVSDRAGVDDKYKQLPFTKIKPQKFVIPELDIPDGLTFQEASERMIQKAKEFRGNPPGLTIQDIKKLEDAEVVAQKIKEFNDNESKQRSFQLKLGLLSTHIENEVNGGYFYHKTPALYDYRIEAFSENTFHVIASSKKGGKRTKKYKKSKKKKTKFI